MSNTELTVASVVYKDGDRSVCLHLAVPKPEGEGQVEGHRYVLSTASAERGYEAVCEVGFQNGPVPKHGVNGWTSEALLAALIHRTETLNKMFPCQENLDGIEHMKSALSAFEARTAKRKARGVEGTYTV